MQHVFIYFFLQFPKHAKICELKMFCTHENVHPEASMATQCIYMFQYKT